MLKFENILTDNYWFAPLSESFTGLPVMIWVDEGAYIRNLTHPLCIYFHNGYKNEDEFIPITISGIPKIYFGKTKLKLNQSDFRRLIEFITRNVSKLKKIAYGADVKIIKQIQN